MPSIHLVWKQMIPCFLASAPEMRRSVIEGQESTSMSLCDREITLRWQKASATSITCTVLPAILRSLKAILRRFRKGNFSVPQWSEVLSKWLVKDIYFCCDSWHNIAPILLLYSSSIYQFFLSFHLFVCLLFAAWNCTKEGTATDDCDTVFVNQRRCCWVCRWEGHKCWMEHTSCHSLFKHTHIIEIASYYFITRHCLKSLGMTFNHLMFRANCLLKRPGN